MFAIGVLPVRAYETYVETIYGNSSDALTNNKGTELSKKGDYVGARRYFDTTIAQAPKNWVAYYNRAGLSCHEGKWQPALQDLETVIRLQPSFFMATIMRGWVNERLGRYGASLADYERILSLRPLPYTKAEALSCRAWIRATCPETGLRNGKQAVVDAKGACNITSWDNADYIDTLAAACAETGDFDSAVRFEQRAIARHNNNKSGKSITGYEHRLAMYQQHHPYHQDKS